MKTFLREPADLDDIRTYQRVRWGRMAEGETCVIELSGLAAKGADVPIKRRQSRNERVELIFQKIWEHKPKLVVMYGHSEKTEWERIAGVKLELDRPQRVGSTLFVFTTHPNTRGCRNSDWERLGKKLQEYEGL